MIDGQPLGWCLAIFMALTALGCLWILCSLLLGARTQRALLATLGATALTLALGVVRVHRDHAELIELVLKKTKSDDPSRHARLIAETLNRTFHTLVLTPQVLTLAMGLVACALVRKHRLTPARTLALAAATLVGFSMFKVWWTFAGLEPRSCGSSEDCLYEEIAIGITTLRTGRLTVVAVACLVWVVALVRMRREAMRAVTPMLARASSALLVLGLVALVVTRGMRWDSWHLLPLDAPNVSACIRPELHASLPAATSDCIAQEAPVLDLSLDAASVDGTSLTRPEQATEVFQSKADLWRQINPGRSFPGTFIVLAPSQAKPSQLLPWIAAAQRAGFPTLAVYMRAPSAAVQTETLGTLHKPLCCARRVTLSDSGAPLSYFQTWDDVAHASHAGDLSVSLH